MKAKKSKFNIYHVYFKDPKEGTIQTLKVKRIEDSPLGLSFVKLSDFVFETNTLLIQPSEEQLKKKFEKIGSLHLSIYHIISIEEHGQTTEPIKFKSSKAKLLSFPAQ